jgi:1,4-dihydroxy-2-naphthoate octaprenyltransferase
MSAVVLTAGVVSLLITVLIGSFFIWQYGVGIAPIGFSGLLLIVTYTGWVNRHPLICLIAPGFGFWLMVIGTHYVLTGQYTVFSWLLALIPFFLVNNLLLLNQYPDIAADTKAGRNHFLIAYGVERSNRVYSLFLLMTMMLIISYIVLGYLPLLSLIVLLPLPLSFYALSGAMKYGDTIGAHPKYLAANVAVTILSPLLLSLSLVLN